MRYICIYVLGLIICKNENYVGLTFTGLSQWPSFELNTLGYKTEKK